MVLTKFCSFLRAKRGQSSNNYQLPGGLHFKKPNLGHEGVNLSAGLKAHPSRSQAV